MQLDAEVPCPNCNRPIKMKLGDMREGQSRRCICGTNVVFKGDGGMQAQRAIDDFQRKIKNLSLSVKFKL